MQILIIEDEKKVARALKKGLEEENFKVDLAHTGEEGFFLINSKQYDLLILDLMLPGRDGIEILKTMREKNINIPVLILTAKDAIEDRVTGLESGADDYLVKPFAFAELLARLNALLRRGRHEDVLKLKADGLIMDLVNRNVTREGEKIELTKREFELLEYLLRNKNKIVTKDMIVRDVWKYSEDMQVTNIIEVYINFLRKKIDSRFSKKLIQTIRGVGYILKE
jgi:DNA-binding response OmpR family regulator